MPLMQTTHPDVLTRTVPFRYEKHSFYPTKKASMAHFEAKTTEGETAPEQGLLRLRKKLLNSPDINAINVHDAKFHQWLVSHSSTPWVPGTYLFAYTFVEQADAAALAWEAERDRLADIAAASYPRLVAEMEGPLGALYNVADYPTAERFRQSYSASHRFLDLGVPNVLKTVRADIFAREMQKVEADAAKAREQIQGHLLTSLLDITEHVKGLLTRKADGKWPILREGALDDLNTYLATLELRDVTNFDALRAVTADLQAIGAGRDVAQLRSDKDLRAQTATVLEDAKAALTSLVEDRKRGIRFRDEDEQ